MMLHPPATALWGLPQPPGPRRGLRDNQGHVSYSLARCCIFRGCHGPQLASASGRTGRPVLHARAAPGTEPASLDRPQPGPGPRTGLHDEWLASHDALQGFAGCAVMAGSQPVASVYSGHQFGHWAGQLGDGTAHDSSNPVEVSGLSHVTAIAVGDGHTCAVVSGAVKCWGGNSFGELGNDSTTDSAVPVVVKGLESNVAAITAGTGNACAVVSGSAKCWGYNMYGQLGDGSTDNSSTPLAVRGL